MDEQDARRDPEAEGKGRAELGEHAVALDVVAQAGDGVDGGEAALDGGVRGGEYGGASGGVGGGGVEADYGAVRGGC